MMVTNYLYTASGERQYEDFTIMMTRPVTIWCTFEIFTIMLINHLHSVRASMVYLSDLNNNMELTYDSAIASGH